MTDSEQLKALLQALSDSNTAREQTTEQLNMMRGMLGMAVLQAGGRIVLDPPSSFETDETHPKTLKIRNEDGKVVVEVVDREPLAA